MLKNLDCDVAACYALVISADGRSCYSCCADGNIIVWDLTSFERVAVMEGHKEGASCVDLSADGSTLWTGGLDNTVCSWDVAERRKLNRVELESQVSLSVSVLSFYSIVFRCSRWVVLRPTTSWPSEWKAAKWSC